MGLITMYKVWNSKTLIANMGPFMTLGSCESFVVKIPV